MSGHHLATPTASSPTSAPETPTPAQRRRFISTVAAIAAVGGALFGYDTGVISGALLYIAPDFSLSSGQEGLVTSILLIGAAAGALTGGRLADALGRRWSLVIAGLVFIIATIGCALAPDVAILLVGRFVLGLAVGIASVIVPLYIAEMAPSSIRGRLVSLNSLMIVTGQLIAYVVNALLARDEAWRWMLGIAAVPAIILVVGMLLLPDTPHWYQSKGRDEDALRVLKRGHSGTEARAVLASIRHARDSDASAKGGRADLRQWWVIRTLLIVIGVAIFQQITGVNTIIYFAPTLLVQTGLSSSIAIVSSIAIGVVSVVATMFGLRLVDRIARRKMLVFGAAGGVVSLAALGIVFPYADRGPAWSFLALGLMVLFLAFQQSSVATTTYLIISELVPANVRGFGMGIAGLFLWLTNFGVSLAFLPVVGAVGGGFTFLGFSAIGIIGIVFILKFVPETRGATLERIEEHMREDAPTGAIQIITEEARQSDADEKVDPRGSAVRNASQN